MEKIVITRPHETVANLTELATLINTEHNQVETAIRDGLEHARKAGALLLQVKARIPHGNWLPWLEANCKATARTAQRYIKVAERWKEIVAKGGKGLGLHGALKLLTRQADEPGPNTTRASYLPPALAYYHENGHLDDNALRLLLDLEQDYGPEVLSPLNLNLPFPEEKMRPICALLNMLRPLDHPPLWPYFVEDDVPAGILITATFKILFADGRARGGKVPAWEITAFWFASTMISLAKAISEFAADFANILARNLENWRNSFRVAVLSVGILGKDPKYYYVKDAAEFDREYWGYRSDVRHAGATKSTLELLEDHTSHPNLYETAMLGFADEEAHKGYLLPSNLQGRLDKCSVPPTVPPDEGDGDDHGDAWEHPEDRLAPAE